ncbi:MAG: YjgP/YjgQ family permease [bacterium]|nr:YjgP/YjgQ family permease [bacterium]
MKILHKYILREITTPFFSAIFITTFILLLMRIFKMVEMVMTRGVDALAVAEMFFYLLPWLLQYTVPMAILVAVLMAFSRMSGDSEVIAMKASGVSLYNLAVPVALLAAVLSAAMFFFDDRVVPEANLRFKQMLFYITAERPDLELKERVFIDDFPGYELYIAEIDPRSGRWYDVTVFVEDDGKLTSTIIAKEGEVLDNPGVAEMRVMLYEGEIHEINPDNPEEYRRLNFTSQQINLPFATAQELDKAGLKGVNEMTRAEMEARVRKLDEGIAMLNDGVAKRNPEYISLDDQKEALKNSRYGYLARANERIALPFACLAFMLVGIPLGIVARRSGKGAGFGISVFFFLVYYVLLVAATSFAERGVLSAPVALWLPNILVGTIGLWLFYNSVNERETIQILGKLMPNKGWIKAVKRLFAKKEPKKG